LSTRSVARSLFWQAQSKDPVFAGFRRSVPKTVEYSRFQLDHPAQAPVAVVDTILPPALPALLMRAVRPFDLPVELHHCRQARMFQQEPGERPDVRIDPLQAPSVPWRAVHATVERSSF